MRKLAAYKIHIIILMAGLVMMVGWWLTTWIFRSTDITSINRKMDKIQQGETRPFTDVIGIDAEKVCWIIPSYEYYGTGKSPEIYLSNLLGAPVKELPYQLGDSESGYNYLLIRRTGGRVQEVRLISGWGGRIHTQNWCAQATTITIHKGDKQWFLQTESKQTYKFP